MADGFHGVIQPGAKLGTNTVTRFDLRHTSEPVLADYISFRYLCYSRTARSCLEDQQRTFARLEQVAALSGLLCSYATYVPIQHLHLYDIYI